MCWIEVRSGLSWDQWMEHKHRKKDSQGHCSLWERFHMSPMGWSKSDVLPASVQDGTRVFEEAHRYAFYWVF